MNLLERFRLELRSAAPRPEILALTIAGVVDQELEIETIVRQLDELAAVMERALHDIPSGYEHALRFLDVIRHDLGFKGNSKEYYAPDNSYLHIVLRRRTGLPIMLSLVCMAIGARLGLDMAGIGFPGHFMTRYRDERGEWLLDPFHGEVIEVRAASHYLSRLFEQHVTLSAEQFRAVTAPELVQRILLNLRNAYLGRKEYIYVLQTLDYLQELTPADASLWQEKGLIHYHLDNWEDASYALRRYFYLAGQLMLVYGQEQNKELAQATLQPHDVQLIEIYQHIEETRRRLN
ncbi:MAG: transglutaminase-like domain-containing protein [Caldilineaceae bacterium]